VWCVTPAGKRVPVNIWTAKAGKIVMLDPESDAPLIRFLKKDEPVTEGTRRYISHFTTCGGR